MTEVRMGEPRVVHREARGARARGEPVGRGSGQAADAHARDRRLRALSQAVAHDDRQSSAGSSPPTCAPLSSSMRCGWR